MIFNGVDRKRFKPLKKKTKRDYYKIVAPCTLDSMRESFLNAVIDSATKERRVFIFGMDCGAILHESPYVKISPDKFDIEKDIADADEVAGILLGRVNLEAWSCGIKSTIYNPDSLEYSTLPIPKDFDEMYNIKNVAKRIIDVLTTLDDVTFIIPHHDRTDKLKDLLDDLRDVRNVMVVKSGTFAEGCWKGFINIETEYVCFLNDDIRIHNTMVLRSLKDALGECDIIGARTSEGCTGFNIIDGKVKIITDNKVEGIHYPSGCCLMMKSATFKALKGFLQIYINGCEDVDLFLRAENKGYKIGVAKEIVEHHEGSSSNRYDKNTENIETFNQRWKRFVRM